MKSLSTVLLLIFGAWVGYWLGSSTGNQLWACLLLSFLGFSVAGFIRYVPSSMASFI